MKCLSYLFSVNYPLLAVANFLVNSYRNFIRFTFENSGMLLLNEITNWWHTLANRIIHKRIYVKVSADSNDVGKDEELGSVEDLTAKNEQKLRFPDNFDPFRNLDQLEKLLTFKVNETDEWEFLFILKEFTIFFSRLINSVLSHHNQIIICDWCPAFIRTDRIRNKAF